MDSIEINTVLNKHPPVQRIFKGVYPQNNLIFTPYETLPAVYIVNTDLASGPGVHWIGIYIDKSKNFYFDSLAVPPHTHIHICRFLKVASSYRRQILIRNIHRIQSVDASTCGFYAVTFVIHMAYGGNFKKFIRKFDTRQYTENDRIVYRLYKRYKKLTR